ncbi:aldehyde dehydrogenase [Patiriisocius marinistellae]|uniref:Aldehyde dehydrogenase n=1 Tax=Patiriisocius marinistellae TaxID=2494560 RepID=A0A5J4FTY5_9FLAO|nr:aldehyde dehydrogenase [Patiriisocius marinistellae]GEQ86047.1 aldehyde dehydrogenase [Patiriisocius marinistellae]
MEQIISSQRNFFNTHQTKDLAFRVAQLDKLSQLLKTNQEALDEAIYADFKKSKFENSVTEMALLFNDIEEAKKKIWKWARKQKVKTNLTNFPAKSYIISEPLGVCLVIGAWNYPYQLSLAPVIAAIAAGNTIILKPSELPSRTSAIMAKLINNNFDSSFLKVIEGGVDETTELLKQKFDKIFFTGSTKVGKIIYKAAAENLTPVTLEMGGKSPTFVTEDANLKMTVKRLVWAKFLNAGQTCIAPDYIMVDKKIENKFIEILKAEISEADYSFENGNYLQIINEDNFERLASMINQDNVCFGGSLKKSERYIQPTVLKDVTFEDDVMQEEIFGPILPVIPYNTIDEAITKVNSLTRPLSCYVFTSSSKIKKKIFKEISFGGGAVNEAVMHITNPHLPFGGVGHSGMGNYHGKAGFDTFTHYKSILDKPTWLELPLKYGPYSEMKLKFLRWVMKF